MRKQKVRTHLWIKARQTNRCVLTLFKLYKHIQFCLKQNINNKRKENKWESQDRWKCMRNRMSQTVTYRRSISVTLHPNVSWTRWKCMRNRMSQTVTYRRSISVTLHPNVSWTQPTSKRCWADGTFSQNDAKTIIALLCADLLTLIPILFITWGYNCSCTYFISIDALNK